MAVSQNFPDEGPSLNLNFAGSRTLDSRVSFTRSSSATYMNENGLITLASADSPRFDHSYDGNDVQSMGLLIEEPRTNLLTYSIPNVANWFVTGGTLTENNAIAPDGTQTATLFTGTGGSLVGHLLFENSSLTTGTSYTQTFFVKAGTTEFVQIFPSSGFDFQYANFQLTGNGVIGNYDVVTPPTIEKFPNGWYRIRVTAPAISTTSGRMGLASIDSLTDSRAPAATEKTFYVWGAQLEAGSFPTSYIPTTASTVTRSADNASITGTNFSSWFNQSEGTVFCSFKNNTIDFVTRKNVYSIVGSAGLGGIELRSPNIGSNRLRFVYNENFNAIPDEFSASLSLRKTAFAYNQSVSVAYIDNQPVTPATTHTNDTSKDNLILGNRVNTVIDYLNGTISQLTYYPKRLTNDQLQTLTK